MPGKCEIGKKITFKWLIGMCARAHKEYKNESKN